MTRLEQLIADVKMATTQDLMDSGEMGSERMGEFLIALSIFFGPISPADTAIMLALHFGVFSAEMDEALKTDTRPEGVGFKVTFEEHLQLFCEYARVSYRDRQVAGFIEDKANVPTPNRAM